MAQINFDSSQVAPSTGTADAIPAGWYNVVMDESDLKPTSKNTPESPSFFLLCRFNVMDGQYAGRKLFSRLNIRNPNPQAMEIAYRDLSAICHAVGMVGMVQDSSMLHGKPLKVKVTLRPATAEYEAQNEIKAYKNINDTSVGNVAPAGVPGAAAGYAPGQSVVPPPAAPSWAPPAAAPAQPAYGQPAQPAQYQPPAAPPYAQQPAAAAPAQGWAPPAGAQPWQQPAQAPAPAPMQAPPQQYAPAAPQGAAVNPMANQPPPWAQQP